MLLVSEQQIKEYTAKGYWGSQTIADLVYQNARETPEDEAIVDPYNRRELLGSDSRRLTYYQMVVAVDRLAIRLIELGVEKNDIVAVQLPNVTELIITYLAASRVGAIITPLGIQYRRHELSYVLRMCLPKVYVGVTAFKGFNGIEMAKSLAAEHPSLRTLISVGYGQLSSGALSFDEIIEPPLEENYPKDYLEGRQSGANEVFSICWTSGTEAEPKGVPRSHNHWIVTSMHNKYLCRLPPRCTILASFPIINMAGIGAAFMPWVANGGKLVLHHPFDARLYMKQIAEEQVYYTMAPPAILVSLDRLPEWTKLDKRFLKVLATGGSPLPYWIVKKYQDVHGIDIVNEFASNEGFALLSSPLFFPDPDDRARYFPRWGGDGIEWEGLEQVPDEHAKNAMKATESKLVDPNTGKVITERGIVGELRYRSPVVFSGYWQRRDLTEKVFDKEGYYCTGDLFSIEGEMMDKYLFHGRYKELIIRGGQNISPLEIENLVGAYPKVYETAAVGYPDERLGERVCIVVVPKPGEIVTLQEIVEYLKEKDIAVYKLPERMELIECLPRNAINKVEKNKLKEMLRAESTRGSHV